MASGVIVATAAGLVTNLIIPRLLSLEDAGAFFIAASATVMVPFLLRLGLDRSGVRRIADATARKDDAGLATLARTQLIAAVIVGVVAALALGLGGWSAVASYVLHSQKLVAASGVIVVWIVCESVRTIFSEGLRGYRHIFAATWLGNSGRAALFAILLPLALLVRHDAQRLTWCLRLGMLASVVVTGLALAGFLRRARWATTDGRLSGHDLLTTFRLSWPFYVTALWGFATNQGDVLIAGAVMSKQNVAFYAAASKVSLLLSVPSVALNQLLAPEIPGLWAHRRVQTMERRIRSMTTLYGVPILVGGLVLIIGHDLVVRILFPATYTAAGPVLAILTLGPMTTALTGPNSFTLLSTEHSKTVARIMGVVSCLQLASMAALGATVGPYGLAAASSVGTAVLNISMSVAIRRALGFGTEPYVRPRDYADTCRRFLRRSGAGGDS